MIGENTNKANMVFNGGAVQNCKITIREFNNTAYSENGYISCSYSLMGLSQVLFAIAYDQQVPSGVICNGYFRNDGKKEFYINTFTSGGTPFVGIIPNVTIIAFGY